MSSFSSAAPRLLRRCSTVRAPTIGAMTPGRSAIQLNATWLGAAPISLAMRTTALPELIDLVWNGKIKPGKVFDLTLPLEQVAEGYRAMGEPRDQDAAAALKLPYAS